MVDSHPLRQATWLDMARLAQPALGPVAQRLDGKPILLTYAIALSYSLGARGRVNLVAVANEEFYIKLGFQATTMIKDGDRVFEISADKAIELLQSRGLINA